MTPSAVSARSSATQAVLFGASNPTRAPFLSPDRRTKVRAARICASRSAHVAVTNFPSRASRRKGRSGSCFRRWRMFWIKFIVKTNLATERTAGHRDRETRRSGGEKQGSTCLLVSISLWSLWSLWLTIVFKQLSQIPAQRRQIIFPILQPCADREFRVATLQVLFEVDAHLRHDL